MATDDQDKTDPASEYKLRKAREQGRVARSPELNFAVLLLGMTCVLSGMGTSLSQDLIQVLRGTMAHIGTAHAEPNLIAHVIQQSVIDVSMILIKPLAIIAVLVIVSGLAQVGFVLSTAPLTPDFSKLNPAKGMERIFSKRSLFELGRSLFKVGMISGLVWLAGAAQLKSTLALLHQSAGALLPYLTHTVSSILGVMTILFGILAALDFAYTRWDFMQNMRMSKREKKDEHKQREGDPRIKSRLRELRAEWLKKSTTLQKVKDADVLVTNPTHLAIAIAYQRETMSAPRILAKGAGDVALKMKELARRHGVMVVENRPLAQGLYREVEPDSELPERHYADVARILAWVFAARRKTAWQ